MITAFGKWAVNNSLAELKNVDFIRFKEGD